MDIQKLKEERMHWILSAEDVTKKADAEGRLLTEDEDATVKGLLERAEGHTKKIDTAVAQEQQKAQLRAAVDALRAPAPSTFDPSRVARGGEVEDRKSPIVTRGYKYAKLRSFPNTEAGERAAYISGQWARAAIFGDERSRRWCQDNGIEYRVQTEGTNTAGGALVPDEMSSAIINLREEFGTFRSNAQVMPMGRDVMVVPVRTSGLTAEFVAEGGTTTETNVAFNQVQLTAKKMKTFSLFSAELADDAILSIADFIVQEASLALATLEDTVGYNGAGTAAHGGIRGILWQIEQDSTLAAHSNQAPINQYSEVTIASLATVMGLLPRYARAGARWYCSQLAYDVVFSRLAATAGGNTIQTLGGGFGPSYLGHPIVVTQSMDATAGAITDGTAMVAFGNLAQAAILGERRGITFSRTDERYWELDQVGIKVMTRMDVVAHGIGDTTTAGPMVCLIADAA